MEIRIGIVNAPREISFETSKPAAEVMKTVQDALDQQTPLLTLADDKGKVYLVPTAGIAYVEIGSDASRRVGFLA